jgi:enoyl-CoA hydratase
VALIVKEYRTLRVTRTDQVATIAFDHEMEARSSAEPGFSGHWEFASVLDELRADNGVRVVVITGTGDVFKVSVHAPGWRQTHVGDVAQRWVTFTGLIRWHQAMAEMEKPIVARVNGDANTAGQSVVFASDIIVARRDAVFSDRHMVMGRGDEAYSLVPGDGGATLMPLYMSPPLAKEYLMLGRPYTAEQLERMGMINYAVPAEELDRKVDEIVAGLLERGAYALAWTKRVANRRVLDQLNLTLDAGAAYEMVNFLHLDQSGFRERRTLT